jgi:predicted TPR repeat methyltransferase
MTAPLTRFASSNDLVADRRYAYAKAALAEGDATAAADLMAQTIPLAPDWPPAHFLLGEALMALGRPAEAAAALRRARALDADDVLGAGIRLALLGAGDAEPETAMSPAYVRALFDDYADRFDDHLVETLHYRGPELIMAALGRLSRAPLAYGCVLDLGCGTGLMGAAIRPHAGWLGGCDLSPAMVAKAEQRGLYDDLAVADVVDHLRAAPAAGFDLLTAADVVTYMGDLGPLFAAAARVLAPSGLFALTGQAAERGIVLGADCRYAHGEDHLHAAAQAAGLSVAHIASAAMRLDRGEPVPTHVLVLRKGDADPPGH